MHTYVYPQVTGLEILIVYDEKHVTYLNVTDPDVKTGLYRYIDSHPEAGIVDLIHFCIEHDFSCGLVFDGHLS